jgi:hypothetical protein
LEATNVPPIQFLILGIFAAVAAIAVLGIKILSVILRLPQTKSAATPLQPAATEPLPSYGFSYALLTLVFLLIETGIVVVLISIPYCRVHDAAGIAVFCFYLTILLLGFLYALKERVWNRE